MRHISAIALMTLLSGCFANKDRIQTEFITNTCIKPMSKYVYLTCEKIYFTVNKKIYIIPNNFETDLASIPRLAWIVVTPMHSSLIKPAIVHDWFYRKSCDFTREEADLIFYHMLRNENVPVISSNIMYYAVRWFGWKFYKKDYCNEKYKKLDKKS